MIDFGVSRAAEAASWPAWAWWSARPGSCLPNRPWVRKSARRATSSAWARCWPFAATGGGPFGQGSSPELAYRLVYGPPDLGQLPAVLRPLVEPLPGQGPRPAAHRRRGAGRGERQAARAGLAARRAPGCLRLARARRLPPRRPHRAPGTPLAAAADGGGRAAGVIAASVAVTFALGGAAPHSSAAAGAAGGGLGRRQRQRRPRPSSPVRVRPHRRLHSPAPGPRPAIVPVVITVTSPGTSTPPSASAAPSARSPSPPPVPRPPRPRRLPVAHGLPVPSPARHHPPRRCPHNERGDTPARRMGLLRRPLRRPG